MIPYFIYVIIGTIVGVLSGAFGLQGTILLLPPLVMTGYFSSFNAIVGTSLAALLLPVGLLAVMTYHKRGHVIFIPAIVLAITIMLGMFAGSYVSKHIHSHLSQTIAGFLCISAGLYLIVDVYFRRPII